MVEVWYNHSKGYYYTKMDILSSLSAIGLIALIHASFQLSVSVLTLLGGHSLGAKLSRRRTTRLLSSFVAGAAVMTLLLVSFASLLTLHLLGATPPLLAWAIVSGIVLGIGVAVWLFYYRPGPGTSLWIPRSFARHLSGRSQRTSHGAEAFSLGMTSVVSELVFILPTILLSALILVSLPSLWQLVGLVVYTVVSLSGLVIVWMLIGGGHSLSRIQRWREKNKRFLQFSAGSALIVLGFFVYVSKIIAESTGAA